MKEFQRKLIKANVNVKWTVAVVRMGTEDDCPLTRWLNKSLKIHRGTNWDDETFWIIFYHSYWCSVGLFGSYLRSYIYLILCYFTFRAKKQCNMNERMIIIMKLINPLKIHHNSSQLSKITSAQSYNTALTESLIKELD